eukprot:3910814-Pyramimonas_sp.AAC.1
MSSGSSSHGKVVISSGSASAPEIPGIPETSRFIADALRTYVVPIIRRFHRGRRLFLMCVKLIIMLRSGWTRRRSRKISRHG